MKVSIIVPNRNYALYLPACLDSIASQTYPDIEVLLADGGSDDGSLEILEAYSVQYGWKIYSREDEGQADAIERGLKLATGDIQCWLNSDDFFLSRKAIETIVSMFQEFPTVDIISLGGYYTDAKGRWLRTIKLQTHPLFQQTDIARRGGLVQPSTFWKSNVFHKIGLSKDLPYSFDTYFFIQACQQFSMLINQDVYLSGYRLHDRNLSLGIKPQRIRESARQTYYNYGYSFGVFYLYLLSVLFLIIEVIFPKNIAQKIFFIFYKMNNLLSYLTIYRIPSI
jgi:glycosyltransferase involved in cell wall biosynthesis